MSKWIIKAVVQKSISYLPFGHKVNYLLQKYITKGVELNNSFFNDRFRHAVSHLNYYFKYNDSIPEKSLEIGAGWYPVIPLYLFLCGVNEIHTIDIYKHLKKVKLKILIMYYLNYFDEKRIKDFPHIKISKINELNELINKYDSYSLNEVLSKLNIHYSIQDATKLNFKNNYFDLIHSNNTFEHIYPDILNKILCEFQRTLKNGGIMSHLIDMSDHFSHFDNSITIYNFLKYSSSQWEMIDNSIQPQNRLRKSDFIKLYSENNINIIETYELSDKSEDLKSLKINKEFENYDFNDLAVSYLHLVSKK
jgi:SAM-dependent methyltransferase